MTEKLLVLMMDPSFERTRRVRELVSSRGGKPPEVHVVVPAQVGALEWVTTAEDDAYDEAAKRARSARRAVAPVAAEQTAEAGDLDPVVAVEDALQTFAADEIVVVDAPERDDGLDADLARFGLPVTHLDRATVQANDSVRSAARAVASGRSAATPFVVLLATMVVVLGVAAMIALVAWVVVSLS